MDVGSMTMDELRAALAPLVAQEAAFDGWSLTAVDQAAITLGIAPATARVLFPGGAMDMIDAWIGATDRAMIAALPAEELAALPIRERIRRMVEFRLDHIAPGREALRRALAIMADPRHALRSLQLGWRSADAMWRLAGDTATDFNHYSKRTTLAAIYAATLAVFADDKSEGFADTRAFLNRRIAGVMRFEKAKARLLRPADEHFSPARLLGRLRYPAR